MSSEHSFSEKNKCSEIDLFELWKIIYSKKIIILIVTLLITLLASLYAYSLPKTYQSTIQILPPTRSMVSELELQEVKDFDLELFHSEDIYKYLLEELNSSTLYSDVKTSILVNKLTDTKASAFELDNQNSLHQKVKIEFPKIAGRSEFDVFPIKIIFNSTNPKISYEGVKLVLNTADKLTKNFIKQQIILALTNKINQLNIKFNLLDKKLTEDKESEIKRLEEADNLKRNQIIEKISLARKEAKIQRNFLQEKLKEDILIAKSLGIKTPVLPQDYNRKEVPATKIDIAGKVESKYWMGTKILSQELEALESRETDDPYISSMPELMRSLESLKVNEQVNILKARKNNLPFSQELRKVSSDVEVLLNLKNIVNKAEFSTFRTLKEADMPTVPLSPNRSLIIGSAFILGLVFSIFMVLIREQFKKAQVQN